MKKLIISVICLSLNVAAFCEEARLTWNVTKNINEFIKVTNNAEVKKTNNRAENVGISKQCYGVQPDTELYLPFDDNIPGDKTGKYNAVYSDYLLSESLSRNNRSGYFIYNENKVELKGNKNSYFLPGVNIGSFSFNYWIYPMTTAYNEEIIRIGRQYYNKKDNEVQDQSIINRIENGHLICDFNYVFIDGERYIPNIRVSSYSMLSPNKWNNIIMTFDSYTGIIRCYINGVEEGIGIATTSESLDANVYDLRFHSNNHCLIKICQAFTGLVDEFYIYKGVKSEFMDRYDALGGQVISNVMKLDEFGGFINGINTVDSKPNNSEIRYYYRASDKVFGYSATERQLPWILLANNEFEHKLVKYIQFKFDLLPGLNNDTTPLFKELSIDYEKNLPPAKPAGLKAIALDKAIKLKWKRNSELDTKGYKVYFGIKSNDYFCHTREMSSPMFISTDEDFEHEGITIKGLNNNVIYYFSVTAYDDESGLNESEFANEICCRPGIIDDRWSMVSEQ